MDNEPDPQHELPVEEQPAEQPAETPDVKSMVREVLREELAALRQPEPEPEPEPQDDDLMAQVRAEAEKSPAARLALMTAQAQMLHAQLSDISDPEERSKVRQHILANPGQFRTVKQAREDLRNPVLEERVKKLEQELERERKRKSEDVPTMGRGEPVERKLGPVITQEEWDARQARLSGPERRAEQRKLNRGEVTIKG